MPTRYIKESARTSKNLQAIADFSERLFWRLITTADDYGRCLGCPAIVKAACFPLNEKLSTTQVIKALEDLQENGLISLYIVGDRQYIEFVTFSLHQGAPRAKESKYPCRSTLANICPQVPALAYVDGPPPNTNTNTNTNLSSLNSSEFKVENSHMTTEQIREAWNKIQGVTPCKKLGGALLEKVRRLAREQPEVWWIDFFAEIRQSHFLTGRITPVNGKRQFKANLDWVTCPRNLGKIISGNYNDGATQSQKLKVAL